MDEDSIVCKSESPERDFIMTDVGFSERALLLFVYFSSEKTAATDPAIIFL